MNYYLAVPTSDCFRLVTAEEYTAHYDYLNSVNNGEIQLKDVPEEYQEWVQYAIELGNGIQPVDKITAYDILTGSKK